MQRCALEAATAQQQACRVWPSSANAARLAAKQLSPRAVLLSPSQGAARIHRSSRRPRTAGGDCRAHLQREARPLLERAAVLVAAVVAAALQELVDDVPAHGNPSPRFPDCARAARSTRQPLAYVSNEGGLAGGPPLGSAGHSCALTRLLHESPHRRSLQQKEI